MKTTTATIRQQTFHLHPFRAAYWAEAGLLLLADLHLGKVHHFRRHGIPAPAAAGESNWERLRSLLIDFRPRRVLFLGDLFHSEYNAVWEELAELTRQFGAIHFELTPGNHDILSSEDYGRAGLLVHPEILQEGPFLFSHHPLEEIPDDLYNLAGHVHPSVRLQGQGRQSLRLPCFHFGARQGLLPAFGAFTGNGRIHPREKDQVFVVTETEVIPV